MIKPLATGLMAVGLLLASGGCALARTDAQTEAIVLKFNKDAFDGGDKSALAGEMSDDFIEHHPTGATATPERTKSEFLARFGKPMRMPSGMGGPPAPFLVLVSGNYVLLVTKQNSPDPTAPGKTYEADSFDLFRVNDAGQVAEHWDNGTVMLRRPGTPGPGGNPSGAPGGAPPG